MSFKTEITEKKEAWVKGMSTHIWGEKESCSTLIIKLKNIDTIVIYSHSDTNFQWLMHLHPFKKKNQHLE